MKLTAAVTTLLLIISGVSNAAGIDDLIAMEKRDAERRAELLDDMERRQSAREYRETLRSQREMNELQTLRMLGGQPVVPLPGLQPIGLPPIGY